MCNIDIDRIAKIETGPSGMQKYVKSEMGQRETESGTVSLPQPQAKKKEILNCIEIGYLSNVGSATFIF